MSFKQCCFSNHIKSSVFFKDRSQDSVVSQDKNPTQDSLISETGTEGQEIIDQDQDQDPHPNQEVTLPGQDCMKTKEDTWQKKT